MGVFDDAGDPALMGRSVSWAEAVVGAAAPDLAVPILSTLVGIGIGFAAIGPNIEIQKSIQEAVLDKVEEDGGDPNAQFAELQKDDETMRREASAISRSSGPCPWSTR